MSGLSHEWLPRRDYEEDILETRPWRWQCRRVSSGFRRQRIDTAGSALIV